MELDGGALDPTRGNSSPLLADPLYKEE